ncbi:MAG: TonB-dependent receptor [Marinilabiliales bacterium]|nr:TonB-dependent receptor [Marinilabiliales bacterium]
MRYLKWKLFGLMLGLALQGFPQQKFTLSGYFRDAQSGENLIGATLLVKELPGKGTGTNAYGFYSITLPAGKYQITGQFVGYAPVVTILYLNQSQKLDFNLKEQSSTLEEVTVSGTRQNENITRTNMGVQKLNTGEIKSIPVLFGENDVLKTIQLLPGIKPVGEGSSGFNVRGGSSDQNLILLDEATVFNASHLMGFFSVFNSDAIKDITVYKGNEPAEYGGRLSSVLDIKMNDGNDKQMKVSGGLGLISSRICVEGPIVKDKGSFMITARRTYADLFLKLSSDTNKNQTRLYFYDLNAKASYRLNANNRIYLSGYFGKDRIALKNTFGIDWGNISGTVRWNHLFSDRLFSNTSLIFSNYDYRIYINNGNKLNIISRIQDYGIKEDLQFYKDASSTIKLGFASIYHKIIPGIITSDNNVDLKKLTNKFALENALYMSHQYNFTESFKIEYGIRFSLFSALGPGDFYSYDTSGRVTDTQHFGSRQFVCNYFSPEPRITLDYRLSEQSSLKASAGRNMQNLHLLSNSNAGNPTDRWIPSSNNVKPESADQFSVGYYRNFKSNQYEFSAESYYKKLGNQIDYKSGAELLFNENVESQILTGNGRAYGMELYLKKRTGILTGWISYTLSKTERKFDGINEGRYFPAKQDRTHDLSIVGMYDLGKQWTLSATWVYYTGNAVTFPIGKYAVDGKTMFYYGDRNVDRMPAYHRLDLGATWRRKKTGRKESSWNFSLYNAYGRDNAYMITFRENKEDPNRTEAVQTTLFKMVPSVTYNFKF